MLHIVDFGSIVAAVSSYALWRGGAPETWARPTTGIDPVVAYDEAPFSRLYKPASGKISYPMIVKRAIGPWRRRARCRRFDGGHDWSQPNPELIA